MTDVIQTSRKPRGRSARTTEIAPDADAHLLRLVELLFFAYRDFTGEADAVLAADGLGRAHHRVLHFVNRHPGIRVADLLSILKITKQSLGRVLRNLIEGGWIEQVPGSDDRRERQLMLTPRGATLAGKLARLQTNQIAAALHAAEHQHGAKAVPPAVAPVEAFLYALIASADRAEVSHLVSGMAHHTGPPHTAPSRREPEE